MELYAKNWFYFTRSKVVTHLMICKFSYTRSSPKGFSSLITFSFGKKSFCFEF